VRRFEVGDESRIVDARGDELMNASPIAPQLVELLLRKQAFRPSAASVPVMTCLAITRLVTLPLATSDLNSL